MRWGFGDIWGCPFTLLHPVPTPVARLGLLRQRLVVKDRVCKARGGSTAVVFFMVSEGFFLQSSW